MTEKKPARSPRHAAPQAPVEDTPQNEGRLQEPERRSPCNVEGCHAHAQFSGLCGAHYATRRGDMTTEEKDSD